MSDDLKALATAQLAYKEATDAYYRSIGHLGVLAKAGATEIFGNAQRNVEVALADRLRAADQLSAAACYLTGDAA